MHVTSLKTVLSIFLLTLTFSLLAITETFAATNEINVKLNNSKGESLQEKALFKVENIYPGWSESKTIYVKNESKFDTNLYFKLKIDGDDELAKELKLFVTRLGNNQSVRIGGSGDRFTLNSANHKNLFLDKLNADKGKRYRIKIKFDKDAGNEFQGLSTKLDLKLAIEGEVDSAQTETTILTAVNRPIPAENLTIDEVAEAETEVLGDNTPTISTAGAKAETDGIVAGASTDCKNTDKLLWALALLALGVMLFVNSFRRTKLGGHALILNLLGVALFIAVWYFLEPCRLLYWVPLSAFGIGITAQFGLPLLIRN